MIMQYNALLCTYLIWVQNGKLFSTILPEYETYSFDHDPDQPQTKF